MICVVCESGWILVGQKEICRDDELHLKNASIVRRWNNGKGIGGIAKRENKEEYILDHIGDVIVKQGKILFTIPCEW